MVGSSDNGDIAITITVDNTGAITAIDAFNQKIIVAEKEVEKFSETINEAENATSTIKPSVNDLEDSFDKLGKKLAQTAAAYLSLKTVAEVIDWTAQGSAINNVTTSFGSLSEQAGTTGGVLLGNLKQATSGTISDFDLMKQSVISLRAGLNPDAFDTLAAAATNLAIQTGGDATAKLEQFTTAFDAGVTRARTYGVGIIDVKTAQKELLDVLGDSSGKLSAQGTLMANQAAILAALSKASADAAAHQSEYQIGSQQLSTAVSNLKNDFLTTLAATIAQTTALHDAATAVKDATPQVSNFAKGLGVLATDAIEATAAVERLTDTPLFKNASANAASAFSTLFPQFAALNDDLISYYNAANAAGQGSAGLAAQIGMLGGATDATGAKVKSVADYVNDALGNFKGLHSELTTGVEKNNAYQKSLEAIGNKISELTGTNGITELHEQLTSLFEKEQMGDSSPQELVTQLLNVEAAFVHDIASAKEFDEALSKASTDANAGLKQMAADAQTLDNYIKLAAESGRTLMEVIADPKGAELAAKEADQVAAAWEEAAAQIAQAFAGAINNLINGAKFTEQSAESLGSSVGSAIGGALGGQGGAAAGSVIGDIIGKLAFDMNADSAGTEFRKSVDKFFADAFNAHHLEVIINGQLKDISDLDFGGKNFGNPAAGFFDAFKKLPAAAQQSFNAVGSIFAAFTGQDQKYANDLAAAITNNIGGSLLNLREFVQDTGKSFADLSDSVLKAFLAGGLSATQFAQDMQVLNGTFAPLAANVQNATEAITQFQAALADGDAGSLALEGSIQQLASIAQSAGIHTFADLENVLVNTFHEPIATVETLIKAIQAAGETVDQFVANSTSGFAIVAADAQAIQNGQTPSFLASSVTDPTATSAASKASTSGTSTGSQAASAVASAAQTQRQAIDSLATGSAQYQAVLANLTSGEISSKDANVALMGIRNQAAKLIKQQTIDTQALQKAEQDGASQRRINALLLKQTIDAQNVSNFGKSASDLTNGLQNGQYLLPAGFNIAIQGAGAGANVGDISKLITAINTIPPAKSFTLNLRVNGTAQDKKIMSNVTAFSGSSGPGQATQ